MNAAETALELWDVELPHGEIRTMTLDDLDAAYQGGEIEESTRVRLHGAADWSTLAVVAGLEQAPPVEARPSAPHSLSPTALSVPTPSQVVTPSVVSMPALDSVDDIPENAFKKSKKGLVLGAVGAAAVMAVVVIFGSKALKAADAAQEAAKAAAASKESFNPHAAMDLPPAELDKARAKLTEEQRKKLEEADKRRAEEAAKKAAERARNAPAPRTGHAPTKGDGLVKTGDKYDPLNGAL